MDKTFSSYQEWQTHDKSNWGEGDWLNEPDKAQWNSRGLICLIIRDDDGHFYGYVGVPPNHPYYQKGHEDVNLYAHGGMNFSGTLQLEESQPEENQSGESASENANKTIWWFGFHCGHTGDLRPVVRHQDRNNPVYRNLHYVMCEIETLADQLASPQ